jgi:hypothetical protein
MKPIREELQEFEDEQMDGYKLKTNEEIIDMIMEFGNGELAFHTLDINRLVVENRRLIELLEDLYDWKENVEADGWWIDAPSKGGFDFDKVGYYIKRQI